MKKTFIHRLTFAQAIMVLPLAALCQGGNDTTDVYFNPDKGLAREHYEKMSRRKTTYDINMEGYVGSAGENTIWGFSANPQANIPVGKKADITAGISVMQSYYNGSDFLWPGYDGSGRRFSQPQHNGRHTLRRSIVLRKQQADCTRFRFYEYFWQQQPFRPIERFFRRRRLPHFAPRMAQFQLFIHGRRYAISVRILRLRTLRTSLWCWRSIQPVRHPRMA